MIVFNGPPVSAFFLFGISCLHLLLLLFATPTILGRRQSSELLHKTLPGDKKRNYIRRIFLPASFSPSLFFSGALFQTRPRQNGCFRERRGFFRVPVSPLGNDRGQTMFLSSYVVLNSLWILCGLFLYNATVSTVHDPCRIWLPFACLWLRVRRKGAHSFLFPYFPPLSSPVRSFADCCFFTVSPPLPALSLPQGEGSG